MNLTNLYYFLKVADIEHMTQAAAQLHITQPALSRAISSLEQELGVELFEREGKNIRLNENGTILRDSAQRIFLELDSLQQRLTDARDGVTGSICISSSFPNREPDLVQMCILEFMNQYPDVAVNYLQHSPTQLQKELEEHRVDLAITSMPIHTADIEYREVFTERLGILISKDHPLAQQETIHVAQLRNERFYCNNANTDTQDLTLEFCRKAGFEPNIFFQGFFPELIGRAVSKGSGVSFLVENRFHRDQETSTQYSWQKNLTFRPVAEDFCCRTCGIAYLKKGYHSKAMQRFYEFFLEYFRTALK